MTRYIVQRLLLLPFLLVVYSFVIFAIMQAPPGDFLTTYVATEFGKQGVRCNAISPGFILIPEKPGRDAVTATMLRHTLTPRVGVPDDIAALVVFLASDESAFITGQNISVDGGLRAHQPYVADFRGD